MCFDSCTTRVFTFALTWKTASCQLQTMIIYSPSSTWKNLTWYHHRTCSSLGSRISPKVDELRDSIVTVTAYINHIGCTHSATLLLQVMIQVFKLVNSIPLQIRARHILEVMDVLANTLSRVSRSQATERMLHPEAL